MPLTLHIENEEGMAGFAAHMAPFLKAGDVLALRGDLGAGKTAFARALINVLSGVPEEVPSPTFTLVQVYDLPPAPVYHFDLYRLHEEERDILELGWEDARRFGISLVEWPDRLGGLLPADRLDISIGFSGQGETARTVTLAPHGAWRDRLRMF
jgi:tRNA threonylcarbamoyladenosine biosynthesis protein TsaE